MTDERKSEPVGDSSAAEWQRNLAKLQAAFESDLLRHRRTTLALAGLSVAFVLATAATAGADAEMQRKALHPWLANEQNSQLGKQFGKIRFEASIFTADEQDIHAGKKLEAIRLGASTPIDGKFSPGLAGLKYLKVFREIDIDLEKGEPAALAKQIAASPLRKELLAALDHWAEITTDQKLLPRLLQVARAADPDLWRDQVRDVKTWDDKNKLLALAQQAKPDMQSPPILILLSSQLAKHGNKMEAASLLRKALLHYPRDFWLYFHLGGLTNDPAERAGYYLAALALHPACVVVRNNYGVVLLSQGKLDDAMAHFGKAVQHDPKFAPAYTNLGLALKAKGDLVGAVAVLKNAVAINPKDPGAYFHLGNIHRDMKDLDGAAVFLRKTIELDPKYPFAHLSLGLVLYDKKDIDGAIACFKKSLEIDLPSDVRPHFYLGLALQAKGDVPGAIKCFQQVLQINPNHVGARKNLEALQKEKK